jgi:hypothetical protein
MLRLLEIILLTGVAIGGSAAQAHDFFLLPDQFSSGRAGPVDVQATVGSSFPTPENVVTADRVDRLFAEGAGKPRLTVVGTGTKALNLRLAGASRGTVAAAVKAKDRDVEYAEDRIPLILEEYRVSPEAVAAVNNLAKPRALKVVSRRFAKTLVCVDACGNRAAAARPFGADLEFVAAGPSVDHFRLLNRGQPLARYPVDVVQQNGKRLHLTTDAKGEVHLPATLKGSMMLFAALMTPPTTGERFTLDLSTLTFSRP